MQTLKLLSGHPMPVVGLGTWPMKGEECRQVVKEALALGYTHFDTAYMYKNQIEIGEALEESGADRSELFITSKLWHDHLKYNDALMQSREILQELRLDYLDLLLIHWPNDDVPMEETFRALGEVCDSGKARSIGVSNFTVDHMERAVEASRVPISVNQIKYHPGHEQRDVLRWCQDRGIVVTAYSPVAKQTIFKDPALVEIAGRHNKTPAQVCLKWLVQKGLVVIPKSSNREHLMENLDLFDWTLTEEEMAQISGMADRSGQER